MFDNPPPKRILSDVFQTAEDIRDADQTQRLSCADVLRNRQSEVALFTPALLVTHGNFDRDPVVEFTARFPAAKHLQPFCIELTRNEEFFFEGLGAKAVGQKTTPVYWDRRLYAIDVSRKDECFAFLNGIAFSDPKTGFFASTFSYEIVIPDPTSKRNETLVVTVFGVLANKFVAMLQPRQFRRPVAVSMPMTSQISAAQFLGKQYGIFVPGKFYDPIEQRDL